MSANRGPAFSPACPRARQPCHHSQFRAAPPCNTKNAPCSFPALPKRCSLLLPCITQKMLPAPSLHYPKDAPCSLAREDSFEDVETLRKLGSNRIGSPCNFSKSPCKSQIAGKIRPRDRFAS